MYWENMIYGGTTLIEMLHPRDDCCVLAKIVAQSLIRRIFVVCLVFVTAYLTG